MWKIAYQYRRHLDSINAVDIDATELKIATAGYDNYVGIFDLNTQDMKFLQGHTEKVEDVAFGPDLSIAASVSRDTTCIIWDTKTSAKLGVLKGHQKTVRCLCWSPDYSQIVTGSNDHNALIWNVEDFSRGKLITGLKGWVRSVQWKDNTIALAGDDKYIHLFDTRSAKIVQTIETKSSSDINSISFHHHGSLIAGGGFDQHLSIWDLRNSQLIRKQEAHSQPVTCVRFAPYTDDFLTVGMDGVARIWSLKCPDVISSFGQHEDAITSCCWYKSGKGFVTVGSDRRIIGLEYQEGEMEEPITDGGEIINSLNRMQVALEQIVNTMKTLDDRLMIQEERVKWLKENDAAITRGYQRRKPSADLF